MALNIKTFIDKYLTELDENLQIIDNGILKLKKDPNDEEELASFLRALHTIKGSSRMLKFNNMEQLAHKLENVFKGVKEKRYEISKEIIKLVLKTSDFFRFGGNKIKTDQNDDIDIKSILTSMEKAYVNEPFTIDEDIIKKAVIIEKNLSRAELNKAVKDKASDKINKNIEIESVRVKLKNIDEAIRSINNLIIKQFQLKKECKRIDELESDFINIKNLFLNKKKYNHDSLSQKKINEYLKKLQKNKKIFTDQITLIERNILELQEKILNLRMLPLELILGQLPKMVEEIALGLKKEVNLQISGMDVRLDKTILEKINDPIIHIIRNAIDHGIETPEERTIKGKTETGNINISCSHESGYIVIKIKDDGKGINYEKIRSKAAKLYPDKEEEILNMTENELTSFIFQSGFSTKQDISDLSGRGVGLDIVKYNIEKLKGRISLTSRKDKGCEIILNLPLSLATINGFFVTTKGEKFFIPSNYVDEVILLDNQKRQETHDKNSIRIKGQIIPLYRLYDAINIEYEKDEKENFVIIVESLEDKIGIITESIIEYSSLIYKPLPNNLKNNELLQGIVFDENFNIINILSIPHLINKLKSLKNIDIKKRFIKDKKEHKTILSVDDSSNTREIVKSILEFEKYNVDAAVDGIDAFNKMKKRKYDLIITDINMPKMDGFTLIENIKRDNRFNDIPIIILTSFDNKEYRKKAKELNIDTYLLKSNFDRNILIDKVKKFIK